MDLCCNGIFPLKPNLGFFRIFFGFCLLGSLFLEAWLVTMYVGVVVEQGKGARWREGEWWWWTWQWPMGVVDKRGRVRWQWATCAAVTFHFGFKWWLGKDCMQWVACVPHYSTIHLDHWYFFDESGGNKWLLTLRDMLESLRVVVPIFVFNLWDMSSDFWSHLFWGSVNTPHLKVFSM